MIIFEFSLPYVTVSISVNKKSNKKKRGGKGLMTAEKYLLEVDFSNTSIYSIIL